MPISTSCIEREAQVNDPVIKMATRWNLCLAVLILSFGSVLGIATRDREPKQFKHQREHQRQYDEEDENPYVFNVEDFTPMFKNEHGAIYSLQKFSERSKLLSGIENFRIAAAKANPLTFLTPTHFDAEVVLVVTRGIYNFPINVFPWILVCTLLFHELIYSPCYNIGRGAITLIREKRESFNIERGDVIRVQAGTTVYWINTDENDELRTVCLLKTVNFPSEYTVSLRYNFFINKIFKWNFQTIKRP